MLSELSRALRRGVPFSVLALVALAGCGGGPSSTSLGGPVGTASTSPGTASTAPGSTSTAPGTASTSPGSTSTSPSGSGSPSGSASSPSSVTTATPGAASTGAPTSTGSATPVQQVVFEPNTQVGRASCGAGDAPEDGVQGQVPRADRDSGRSALGYRCNMAKVGQYQGSGAGITGATYAHCAYLGTFFPGDTSAPHPGVNVLDVSNPGQPVLTASLTSPGMLTGTWESLKTNAARGLLAGTGDPTLTGALTFDIYDVKTDCAHPKLLNSVAGTNFTAPITVTSHEGGFSPDGDTYYATSAVGGFLTAIDVSDPTHPQVLYSSSTATSNHGFSISADGNTMYGVTATPAGVQILDISDIQSRKASPQVRQIGSFTWSDGLLTQMTIPFTSHGHPYLYAVDEAQTGGVRLLDVANPQQPVQVREYRLEIDQPSEMQARADDTGGDGAFGYDSHYCAIDTPADPTRLACGYIQSGIRLFDVADPMNPAEIGYYNPPAQTGLANEMRLVNSPHAAEVLSPPILDPDSLAFSSAAGSVKPDMTTDFCASPPTFESGNRLWVTCSDNGFLVLQVTK